MTDVKNMQVILKNAECLYDLRAIEKALDRMAEEITTKLHDKNPLIICVMIGALIPTGHLVTRLNFPLEIDYIHATRYRGATRAGDLHWLVEPRQSLKDRTILIIDDILDEGLTLSAIIDYCRQENAKDIYTAVLVDKKRERKPGSTIKDADFTGLTTNDRFLFGFGLDYDEQLRNIPGIYAVAKEDM